jgi:hypothetical protein
MDLTKVSRADLEGELKRRGHILPEQKEEPDLDELRKICTGYLTAVMNGENYPQGSFEHYLYDVALRTLYGKHIHRWVTEHIVNK